MELRLLRYFVAMAEELHVARAADRLGIEQSPASRAMRELEALLDVQLFDRSARQMRLTRAGQVLLAESRRALAVVDQAIQATRSAAQGYQGCLRIAVCDSLAEPRIAALIALSRQEEPELEIRVFELPFLQQLRSLHNDLLDAGFALSNAVNKGLVAEALCSDPLLLVMPACHPLLSHAQVKLDHALKYPLVLFHRDAQSGCHDQIQAALKGANTPLNVIDHASSLGAMLTLIGGGYGIGFASTAQAQALNRPDITTRPLAGPPPMLTTYLLRRQGDPCEPLKRFLRRAQKAFQPQKDKPD